MMLRRQTVLSLALDPVKTPRYRVGLMVILGRERNHQNPMQHRDQLRERSCNLQGMIRAILLRHQYHSSDLLCQCKTVDQHST